MRFWKMALTGVSGVALMLALSMVPQAKAADWEDEPYIIKDGKVDYGTYNGYRRYHNTCHVCHGPDALGSSFAPALKDSLKQLSYSDFLDVVTNGRQVDGAGGTESVMPSFAENPDVMLYIDHLYAYIKARSNDALGRGRPGRLPPDEDPVYKEWKEMQ